MIAHYAVLARLSGEFSQKLHQAVSDDKTKSALPDFPHSLRITILVRQVKKTSAAEIKIDCKYCDEMH
jgi:hypothetical protein